MRWFIGGSLWLESFLGLRYFKKLYYIQSMREGIGDDKKAICALTSSHQNLVALTALFVLSRAPPRR